MITKEEEIWKDIPEYEGLYQVSTLGNVKALNYNRTKIEKVLIKDVSRYGYHTVSLSKNNVKKTKKVYKLSAITFLGHVPSKMEEVINHIDFNRLNDRLDNLEITTQRINGNKKHLISSSKFTGVSWNKQSKKWQAYIYIKSKRKHLGFFTKEEDASDAYQKELTILNS